MPALEEPSGSGLLSVTTVGDLGLKDTSQETCGHRVMRMVNGKPAAVRKWPWQASLQERNKHFCGGSLGSSQWVLPTATCIFAPKNYTVVLGDNRLNSTSRKVTTVPVQDIILPANFDLQTMKHDIALLLLAFPVYYSSHVQPVCLAENPFHMSNETLCWVTGWSQEDVPVLSTVHLQEMEQRILSTQMCNHLFQEELETFKNLVLKGMICGYQEKGQSPCWGCSGSPLVCEIHDTWIQAGIVSWGLSCGQVRVPAVYTDISEYKKWIKHVLSEAYREDSVETGSSLLPLSLALSIGILVIL